MVLREGHADTVALACGALTNPDWLNRLREGLGLEHFDPPCSTRGPL
jgi:2,4-dienoyl-CoA reductase-like NADH-dependent reductase (Old Yellow Enzyme family)